MVDDWKYSSYSDINPKVKEYFPFKHPRKDQLETISEIKEAIDNGYKYIVLEAGTGTGKSVMAATLALLFDSTYILTITKQLQDQYKNDFKELGFKLVKGRANFKCKKYLEDNVKQKCDEGRCVLEGYNCEYSIKRKSLENISKSNTCEYEFQKWQAMNSQVTISNYHYMFLELNYNQDFTKRNLIVCDEAHNLENTIMNQLKLEFDRKELKDNVGINLSKETVAKLNDGNYVDWIEFIKKIQNKYELELNKIKDINKNPSINEKISFLKKRITDCDRFIKHIQHDPNKWIFDYDSYYNVAEFKPLKVDNYAENTLFKYADVCLFMSATILDYKLFARWLGIKENEIYAIRRKSPFDVSRNPIITYDNFDMSYWSLPDVAPKTIPIIKKILKNHENEKGIIHTVSNQCKNYLTKKLDTGRLISHKTYNRTKQLNKFKKADKPLVLISPSMGEGVDLPGDQCRFQIIYKIPYPSLADKQTKMRKNEENKWYEYKTSLALVQTYGRGMRYENDHCKTYIIDSRFKNYVMMDGLTNNFLPESFCNAIGITPAEIDEDNDLKFSIESTDIKSDLKIKQENKKANLIEIEPDSEVSVQENLISTEGLKHESKKFKPIINEDINLEKSDKILTFDEKVEIKYKLTIKGQELLDNKEYSKAIDFYKKLINHELFINDYHAYLKLSKAYRGAEQFENEVDVLTKFFTSGIYCRKSTLKWFKKKLEELSDLGYFNYLKIDDLEHEFKINGYKNRKYANIPVPNAGKIKKARKNDEKINYNTKPELFDDIVKFNENISYNEKINFKNKLIEFGHEYIHKRQYSKAIGFYNRLLTHELFINDYHPYKKLSQIYRRKKQYSNEKELLIKFFKSGIYCDNRQFKWFKGRLRQLSRYGFYDYSKFNELERDFEKNGALNKKLKDYPVPQAIELINNDMFINLNDSIDLKNDETTDANSKAKSEIPNECYSVEYFNNFANLIKENPKFRSDQDISKPKNADFVSFTEYADINYKADLKEKGKKLEREDELEAIKFYDDLKQHRLFVNDYYPYRRQCILFKNKLKNDFRDWYTIMEIFSNKIYLNNHQYIWLENKIKELIPKLNLNDVEINKMNNLVENYKLNKDEYEKNQNIPVPIAERIFKDDDGLKVLSKEKYDSVQEIYYIKELGVGYIRRGEYEKAIEYYNNLLKEDLLYLKYHAYKQFARIFKEMNNSKKFTELYNKIVY